MFLQIPHPTRLSLSLISQHYLLHSEYKMIEKALQLLISHVDAQLLQAVHGEVLEAKNIKNP